MVLTWITLEARISGSGFEIRGKAHLNVPEQPKGQLESLWVAGLRDKEIPRAQVGFCPSA